MSYQALARKWRPQTFNDVVGQQHVLRALSNGLSLGRIHHAYLFSGTRGVGKTSIARLFAKGLNCEQGITATPCGKCDTCLEIEQGRFVDLIEIDAASRTKVEDTRELLDNVQYAPARGRFKVYLIDEVHMLSRHSFNALLKTLEEPPEHVKFLLATTDPQKLPVTILSRCLQFHLKALDSEEIRTQLDKVLTAEAINADERALQLIARAANGSMRDALSLTDQAIAMGDGTVHTDSVMQMLGTLDEQQPLAIIEALEKGDGAALMSQVQLHAQRGGDWDSLLQATLALLHNIAMVQLLPDALDPHYAPVEQALRELARRVTPTDLQLYYQTLLVGRKELAYAPEGRSGVEMTLLRALAFHPKAVDAITHAPKVSAAAPYQQSAPSQGQGASHSASMPASQGHQSVREQLAKPAAPATSNKTVDASHVAHNETLSALPGALAKLVQARETLHQHQKVTERELSISPAIAKEAKVSERLERLTAQAEKAAANKPAAAAKPKKEEAYRWTASTKEVVDNTPSSTTPKALRAALEYEKTPELAARLAVEARQIDPWSEEIAQLQLPKMAEQLSLNSVKEETQNGIVLHVRSSHGHLNNANIQGVLSQAMQTLQGKEITLNIVVDDQYAQPTPLEVRQELYEKYLAQAQTSMKNDNHVQTLCRYFDATLDEESIRPV